MTLNDTCQPNTVLVNLLLELAKNRYVSSATYLFLMIHLFVAIARIADIFMASIESITSQTRKVTKFNPTLKKYEEVKEKIWNDTVANLSLMSLGSSAPEILLATIEIFANNFEADKLGPGTIVGASMFNTFVITAFCVVAVSSKKSKQILNIKVFVITTFFSLAAYTWLYLMLAVISPNRVSVTESLITILIFPLMLLCGYLADKNSSHKIENSLSLIEDSETSWSEQIKKAFHFDTKDNIPKVKYFTHLFCFVWDILFALLPPTSILGGWLTFFCSVAVIGVLTALVGDLANLIGYNLQISAHTTGITIVAIGTSLPDLFASRLSAKRDHHADNAIGNINGSNAFNVILGLGFPWLCAAIYHQNKGTEFVVTNLTDLTFSVQLFVLFSIFHLVVLVLRRRLVIFGNGELGGPKLYSYTTFIVFIAVWLLYLLLSLDF